MAHSYSLWKIVILVPLFFFIPGATIVLYVRDRHYANLILSEIIVLSLSVSVAVTSLCGLVLAEASSFSPSRLAAVMLVISCVVFLAWLIRRKGARHYRAESRWWWAAGILLLAIVASLLFVGRFEAVLTESDASPYLIEGVNIAQHGKILLENKTMAMLSPAGADLLYARTGVKGEPEYHAGFWIRDLKSGTVATRYFPLFSVLIAISYRMFGLGRTLTYLNPFLALLGLLLVVLTVRRLFDEKIALLSGFILTFISLMVWFARYTIPEMFTLMLVFLGLFCFSIYYPRGNGYWGLLSAFAFSLAVTAHFDMYALLVILPVLIFIVFVITVVKRERLSYLLWFVIPMIVLSAHGWVGHRKFNKEYYNDVITAVPKSIRGKLIPLVVIAIALAVAVAYLLRYMVEHDLFGKALRLVARYWRPALAVIIIALALFAYLVWPFTYKWTQAAGDGPGYLRKTLYRMSWYITHLGIVLSVIGLLLFIIFGLSKRSLAFFTVCGLFTFILLARPMCNPLHMWYLRRLIPTTLPFMVVLTVYAVYRGPLLFKQGTARYAARAVAAVLLAIMLVFTVPYTAKVHGVVQYRGALESLKETAAHFSDERATVFFYGPLVRSYFPETLRGLYGEDALPLMRDNGDPKLFNAVSAMLRSRGKTVYIAGIPDTMPMAAADQWLQPVGMQIVRFDFLRQEYVKRPEHIVKFAAPLMIYDVRDPALIKRYYLDVGGANTDATGPGFYPPEGGKRWTAGSARFLLPNVGSGPDLTLCFWPPIGTRPGAKQVPMKVYVEGKFVAEVKTGGPIEGSAFYQVTFPRSILPSPGVKQISFRLEVPTWSQKEAGTSEDPRRLGVALSTVSIQSSVLP